MCICGVKSSVSLLLCWHLDCIWISRYTLTSFVTCLCVCLAALLYNTRVVPSRAEQPQNSTLWSHKRDVNLVFLVSLLGTVLCDDYTGHNETSALLLLNSMCLGATQFSVYLSPNNCLLCLLKRLLTLSSLHPRKYSSYRWLFCLSALMGAVERWQESQWRFWVCFGIKRGQDAVPIWSADVPLLIKPTWTLWEEVTSCGKLFILTSRSKTHISTAKMEK